MYSGIAKGRLGGTMNTQVGWRDLYRRALLELRSEELRMRIDDAERAIRQRIGELRDADSSSEEESRALDDALRGLQVLASTECKSQQSTLSGLTQTEVIS
jgi:hypothetical protein